MKFTRTWWIQLALAGIILTGFTLEVLAQIAPNITTQPTNQTVSPGANLGFNVAVAGSGPFSFQWQFDGTNLPNINIIIETVAGGGSGGDGGAATNASLNNPYGVTSDAAGNLYIADNGHQCIRKVDTNGIITTVAGNGTQGFSGDGGLAVLASLSRPYRAVPDSAGNFYISDQGNARIRKVDTNGIITTVAGNGTVGYSGDGGAATNANLNMPWGMAFDALGNLYIAEPGNNRVRKMDTNGIITTVAGNGLQAFAGDSGPAIQASLYYPTHVAFDVHGNFYISDHADFHIRKVDAQGFISTVAGNGIQNFTGDGGPAINAGMDPPLGIVLDAAGDLFIAGAGNETIRMVNTSGIISAVAGNSSLYSPLGDGGPPTNANLFYPYDVTMDGVGNLYIADLEHGRIRAVHYAGYPTLALTNVSASNAGKYTVVVGNPYGSVTSTVAVVTVLGPPSILVQPAAQEVVAGGNANFSVAATGTPPLYYSWYFNLTNLLQSGTNPGLDLTNTSLANTGSYTVIVTNASGSATSSVPILTVLSAPATPPVLAAVPDQSVNVGSTLLVTNIVTETNMPPRQISFNLGAGAPSGASVSATGVFQWAPSCEQGTTTNLITLWAVDNGTPALSNSISYAVTVSACVQVSVGSSVALIGNATSVPVNLYSSASLTNVNFSLATLAGRFTNWGVTAGNPAIVAATVQASDPSQPQFNFAVPGGQGLLGASTLGTISVQALPAGHSAFAPLTITNLTQKALTSPLVASDFAQSGRVALIAAQPLLEETLTNGSYTMMTLYGNPGSNYTLLSATNLSSPIIWTPFTNFTLTGPVLFITTPGPPPHQLEFFRARQQ